MSYEVLKEWSYNSFPCMIIRTEMGHLCGYVGVQSGHSFFNKKYNQCLKGCEKIPYKPHALPGQSKEVSIEWAEMMNELSGGHWPCTSSNENHRTIEDLISVHGGITFTGEYEEGGKVLEGGIWWIGFDCAHTGDYNPGIALALMKTGYLDHLLSSDEVYRDEDYVTIEVEQMAVQIKEYESLKGK